MLEIRTMKSMILLITIDKNDFITKLENTNSPSKFFRNIVKNNINLNFILKILL